MFIVFTALPVTARATEIAGQSATLNYNILAKKERRDSDVYLQKKITVKKVLEQYGSPLAEDVDGFMNACQKYELNCYLLPAIAGLESTFGKFIMPESYNPFGWGGGYIYFENWNEGIDTVAKGLRENYIDRGAESLAQIGRIYSESPTWTQRVQMIMDRFESAETDNQLFSLPL